MKTSKATVSVSGCLPEMFGAIAAAGFDGNDRGTVAPATRPGADVFCDAAGLSRFDQPELTMSYDEMLSWSLFYTTPFRMWKSRMLDVVDPEGLAARFDLDDGSLDWLRAADILCDEDAANAENPVLALIGPPERRKTLVARRDGAGYRFGVRLRGEQETVFLDV